MINYSDEELAEVKNLFDNRHILTEEEYKRINKKLEEDKPSVDFIPFYFISVKNEDLFNKIKNDDFVKKYSYLCFLPEVADVLYRKGQDISFEELRTNGHVGRGSAALITLPDKKLILKRKESLDEGIVANTAADLGVGPKQYFAFNNMILEDFVLGKTFSEYSKSMNEEQAYKLGDRVADMLNKLHSKDIVYNDIILMDDFWHKSHLFVPENINESKLIDFGVSLNLKNHPNLTNADAFKYVKTLPGMSSLFDFYRENDEELNAYLDKHREYLNESDKKFIKSRDLDFMNEGATAWMNRQNSFKNIDSFKEGFRLKYEDN